MSLKSEKWSKEEIEALIDAFKDEQCLYASTLSTYHNKHLRGEALERIYQKVVRLRPTTTKDECSKKFKNMRNQFNIENAKVKASLKSGTGTDDVYKPNLWYYSLLLFLDTYITPRKSRNSLEQDVQNTSAQSPGTEMYVPEMINEGTDSLDQQELFQLCTDGTSVNAPQNNCTLITPGPISPSLSTSSNSQSQNNNCTFLTPSSISPLLSTLPTSGKPSDPPRRSKKRSRQDSTEDDFSGAVNNLAESLRQPITINNSQDTRFLSEDSPVNGFLSFIGALLRSFQDEELKLEVMNNISQTVMNAKSLDLQRAKK